MLLAKQSVQTRASKAHRPDFEGESNADNLSHDQRHTSNCGARRPPVNHPVQLCGPEAEGPGAFGPASGVIHEKAVVAVYSTVLLGPVSARMPGRGLRSQAGAHEGISA